MGQDRLTGKQQAFIEAYLSNGFNATAAARTAGYKGNDITLASVGYENLRKPHIAQRIQKRFEDMTMSADEVLMRLSQMARADMTDFLEIYPGGRLGTLDLEKASRLNKLNLIKDFKVTEKGGIEVKLHDAQSALVHLGKFHALFTERIKHEDWHDEVLRLLLDGTITPEDVRKDLGDELANELFEQIGPVTIRVGEAAPPGAAEAD